MSWSRRLTLAALAAALMTTACGRETAKRNGLAPTRGVIVLSLGSVGASRLGAYGGHGDGNPRPTSPFFDRLAEKGALFEHAIAPSPSTLVSNASLFTGLYPQQHGVTPPAKALPPRAETLPERFSFFGYRTAGYTEGGFVGRHFGFHRGFDDFDDTSGGGGGDTAVERTFARGLDFLRGLAPDEPFFLFLHTTSAGAPYEPPPPYDELFALPTAPPSFASTPANLRRADRGFLAADPASGEHFARLHEAGVAYLDGVLESFFAQLDELGLFADSTILVTSDHGEEFLEHGGLGHFQIYPEIARVPLLVLHPDLETGRRIPGLAQTIDIAPTLYELAGLPPGAATSGRSLVPRLEGARPAETWAWSETVTGGLRRQRALFCHRDGSTHQLVETSIAGERDGTWIARRAGLDVIGTNQLAAVSFHRQRLLRVTVDDRESQEITIGTGWTPLDLGLGDSQRHRLDLVADDCDSPRELGLSDDPRCLSLKIRGVEVRRIELFDLDADPLAARDLAGARPELRDELEALLSDLVWSIVSPARNRPRTEETVEILRALGYLD